MRTQATWTSSIRSRTPGKGVACIRGSTSRIDCSTIHFPCMIRVESGQMKTVLSLLLVTLFGAPVFAEDLKVYAAAAFKSPLLEIATQYETSTGHKVTLIFDTAGATEQKFRDDPEAVLLVTTLTLINDAEKMGRLKDGTTYRLGDTVAGLAFSPGSA